MLKDTIQAKKIKRVIHLTRIENVDRILEHGLYHRSNLEEHGHKFTYNDDLRLEGYILSHIFG